METTLRTNKNSIDIPSDFKSTLPPRKRAKTKEEKEQRRIERILRNRKAAHQSREKKRLHLKFLEDKCNIMEKIIDGLNLQEIFINQSDKLKLVKDLNTLAIEEDFVQQQPSNNPSPQNDKQQSIIKQEEDVNSNSFDFTFSMKDIHKSNNNTDGTMSFQQQIPSPSTSVSTHGSISMSPDSLAHTLKNELLSTHIKKEEEEEEEDNIDIDDDARKFALHIQNDNEETMKAIFNDHINSNDDVDNQDFDFEADAATALEHSILSHVTDDSQNNLLLTSNNNELNDVMDVVTEFDPPTTTITGSFDLDNWRNPAAITLIS
ncbi:similar to Saccharomyces cerevisiae YFL031W HAC1 Basic leucine zipper (bZIP) transcription factor (ATF/CREB1 homolog) that regulates the unfolded protein response [Maudiozyma saulgeensis]|uniref:Similar to Saccharomyces cerevisiae YFL031W HAC1 Basic leucine zipper (BZIP) transcription factor (ATF/CREB1 homolog) that regulates the unfolded protein response n=1 Tax=Maudiozyma saulgeensis TaxID=1789683 RepID=A0A1X7QZD4_9SACH|nr:similar to Saccharomyces cerevisiae YFL031W HAC1 Basic leucine zipper (bZIP) transcription factor (ATF/CREB1 homolog) that regulates the unfolded protein response [Kazachstania saulgeensis]